MVSTNRWIAFCLKIFIFSLILIVIVHMSTHILNKIPVACPVTRWMYKMTPELHSACQSNEWVFCNQLNEVTTYSPCFRSALINSKIACHDSFSCQKSSKKATVNPSFDFHRRAFFSALYADNDFLNGSLLLGYTIKKYHPEYAMYLMYFENQLSKRTLCSLRQVGWIPIPVQNIPPPLTGTASQFINQFTKLTLWNMTEFDSIVYLDGDTIVLGDISHLHELVAAPSRTHFEFAAVADNWNGMFAYHFNAGVLVLHPSNAVFNELIRTISLQGNYDPKMAEQAFLNAFFQLRYLQLPLIYNVNLAMYSAYPNLWRQLEPDFKIIHFTVVKPFLKESDNAYEYPLRVYHHQWNDFLNSTSTSQIKEKCII